MSVLAGMIPISAAINAASKLLHGMRRHGEGDFGAVLQETMGQQIVKRWDADGNGSLSVGEFGGDARLFAQFDRDGDGALTARELDLGLRELGREQALQAHIDHTMRLRDADHDGSLTAAELGLAAPEFQRLDANGDRVVNRQELIAAYREQAG